MSEESPIVIRNIYHMMAYAFRCPPTGDYADLATEDFEHIHDLMAAIIARGLAWQVKRGLHRDYLTRTDDIGVLRGRLNLTGTLANRMSRRQLVTCEFDELSEDTLPNQVVKTTALLLLRRGKVASVRRDALRRLLPYLSEVRVIDPTCITWSAIRLDRSSSSYRMMLGACRLVLEGMLLTTKAGEYRLATILEEKERSWLFEHFLLEYFSQECDYVTAGAPHVPWVLDDGVSTLLPEMITDVTLTSGSKRLIIDAKWYKHVLAGRFDDKVRSAHLYQMFAYVKNTEIAYGDLPHKVGGMVLYAQTKQGQLPNVTYQMSGNAISVRTISLNRDFSEISADLDLIAASFFEPGEI